MKFFRVGASFMRPGSVFAREFESMVVRAETKVEAKAKFKMKYKSCRLIEMGAMVVPGIICPLCNHSFEFVRPYPFPKGKRCLVICGSCHSPVVFGSPKGCGRCSLKVECLTFPRAVEGVHY